mgnify:CR=1 FL=1
MTFPDALERIHSGKSVRRGWWSDDDTYIKKNSLGVIEFCDYEHIEEVLFNSDDVQATDWMVV